MRSSETIDVVIATFDRAHLVGQAIESVLTQTWSDVRVHVVDDGSTDRTARLLDDLAASDGRIVVTHRANGGPAAARNSGLAAGQARLVTFLDSDDLMPPHRLETQFAYLEANPHSDGVIGTEAVVVAEGVDPPTYVRAQMNRRGPKWYWQSVMITRAAIESVGGYDESLTVGEDLDIAARLHAAGVTIGRLDEDLVTRRILGDNLTLTVGDLGPVLLDVVRRRQVRTRPR